MNAIFEDQIVESMRERETNELLDIWQFNDRTQWSDAAFDAISQVLSEREVITPPQGVFVAAAAPYKGVRGWLLLLCVNLTMLTPGRIMAEYGAAGVDIEHIRSISIPGLLDTAIAAFSIYAGVGLWRVVPGAVKRATLFICIVLVWNLTNAASIFFAGVASAQIEDQLLHCFVGVLSASIWLAYLQSSKRVKATYGRW